MRYRLKLATWTVVREGSEPSPRTLSSPEAVARLALDLVRSADNDLETLWVVAVNGKNRYLMHAAVSVGTLTGSLVHPREVFRPAILGGAAAIIVVHNHPSGDPTPSLEDIAVTERLAKAGEILGVELLDHVIVGNGTTNWTSFRQTGRLPAGQAGLGKGC